MNGGKGREGGKEGKEGLEGERNGEGGKGKGRRKDREEKMGRREEGDGNYVHILTDRYILCVLHTTNK